MTNLTPQEIQKINRAKRQDIKATQLRDRLEIIRRFKALSMATRAKIRIDLLHELKFDPTIPLSNQSMKIRLVYHNNRTGLRYIVKHFENNIERYTNDDDAVKMKSPFG